MLQLPGTVTPTSLVDWVEASCLFGSTGTVSRAEVVRQMELNELAAEGEDGDPASDIWIEMGRRRDLASQGYPFEIEDWRITRRRTWRRAIPYSFMLLVSLLPNYLRVGVAERLELSILFEQLATEAARKYLGESLRFGHPRQGVPTRFDIALDHVSQRVEEPRGIENGGRAQHKDEGVDVIAWKPFKDSREGKLVLLVQCATGKDWPEKTRDIVMDTWRQYINWTVLPVTSMAVPFVIGGDEWVYYTREAGIIMDRLRISQVLRGQHSVPGLTSELRQWCLSKNAEIAGNGR